MKNKKVKKWRQFLEVWILLLILSLGLLIRVIKLDSTPRGMTVDEVNFGYIAQSLLTTGKDEHGAKWPLSFAAFGEEKLPLGAYVLLPSVYFLGMNRLSVRLPSAIFGTISIFLIYLIAKKIKFSKLTSLILAGIWAVSPITVILSRFAYESNLALTLFLSGLWGMLNLKEKNFQQTDKKQGIVVWWWSIIIWAASWSLSWYSYIAYRPIIVIFLLVFGGLWFYQNKKMRFSLLIVLLMFTVLISPSLMKNANVNLIRFKQIGILNEVGTTMMINENREFCHFNGVPRLICDCLWNKPLVIGSILLNRYMDVYSFTYLFNEGEGSQSFMHVANSGEFNPLVGLTMIIGIIVFITQKKWLQILRRGGWELMLFLGLLIAPIPAISVGEPQKVRLSVLIPFLFLLIGIGIEWIIQNWDIFEKKVGKILSKGIIAIMGIFFSIFTVQYLVNFFTIFTENNDLYLTGYAEKLSQFIAANRNEKKVYFHVDYPDPLMFYSFFTNYDPATYQSEVKYSPFDNLGFQHAESLENLQIIKKSLPEFLSLHPEISNGLYVSNSIKDLGLDAENQEKANPVIYTAYSNNGVLRYAFVVDIARYLEWKTKEK